MGRRAGRRRPDRSTRSGRPWRQNCSQAERKRHDVRSTRKADQGRERALGDLTGSRCHRQRRQATCVPRRSERVAAPEQLAFDVTWACTSMPMTISQGPLAPLISFAVWPDVMSFPFRLRAVLPPWPPTPCRAIRTPSAGAPAIPVARVAEVAPRPGADRHAPRPPRWTTRPGPVCVRRSQSPLAAHHRAVKGRLMACRRIAADLLRVNSDKIMIARRPSSTADRLNMPCSA